MRKLICKIFSHGLWECVPKDQEPFYICKTCGFGTENPEDEWSFRFQYHIHTFIYKLDDFFRKFEKKEELPF